MSNLKLQSAIRVDAEWSIVYLTKINGDDYLIHTFESVSDREVTFAGLSLYTDILSI